MIFIEITAANSNAWNLGIQSYIEIDDSTDKCFSVFSIGLLFFSFNILVERQDCDQI
jgi:hypothetical protein